MRSILKSMFHFVSLTYEFAHRRHHAIYKLTSKGVRDHKNLLNLVKSPILSLLALTTRQLVVTNKKLTNSWMAKAQMISMIIRCKILNFQSITAERESGIFIFKFSVIAC